MSKGRHTYYAVMVVARWDWLTLTERSTGQPFPCRLEDAPGMVGFMPVFGTRVEAEAWAEGRWGVAEVTTVKQEAPA